MSPLALVKMGAHIASAFGVGKVIGDVIKHNTTVVTTLDKILVNTGGFVLGSMVTEVAARHVNHLIDSAVTMYETKEIKLPPLEEE